MDAKHRSPFGIALRQFREAAALSQEQLAERAGLSVRGISDLERGLRATPRLETVRMLAKGLGLTEVELRQLIEARNASAHPLLLPSGRGLPPLPEPVTSFIGREPELHEIERMFRNRECRLLTLLGPGGVGKTRIAIEAAHRLAAAFAGNAVFVDLSTISSPDLVLPTIADHLGVSKQAGLDIKETLGVALESRHMLLVLDNLEQVVEAATDIAWLHASFAELGVIATSRARLRISAEQVLPIEPMALPAIKHDGTLQRVDAVSLFLVRAHAVDPGFTLDDENTPIVAEIVRKLQGMPLAIELAAARIRMLSAADLLARLETQLSVLSVGSRDAPARQRTMRDTIAWSYNLLTPSQQAVFRTLAIFPDGCTLETAVAVCGANDRFSESETVDTVDALIDTSMLRRRNSADGLVRFRMLQTVREYGLEQLAATGEEITARRAAHFAWAIPLVRESEFLPARSDAVFWVNRIEAELQNLRQHQAWLIANEYVEDALDISGSLGPFRSRKAQLDEGRQELEMLLAHPLNQNPTLARVRAYDNLGALYINQGDSDQALEALQQTIALARLLDERWYLAEALILSGSMLTARGQLEESESRTREGLVIATELDSKFLLGLGAGGLAMVYSQRGELKTAIEMWKNAVAISESIGNPWGIALCKFNLGCTFIRDGEVEDAEAMLLDARILLMELGDDRDLPGVNLNLAFVARTRGDLSQAEEMMESTLELGMRAGNMYLVAHSNLGLATIARLRGDHYAAQAFAHGAISWFQRCGNMLDAIFCLADVADILIDAGAHIRAAWCLGALDGVLSRREIPLLESEISERQVRIDTVVSKLGEADWQYNYDRALALSENDILAEAKSWLLSHKMGGAASSVSNQSARSDYDNGTQ